MRRTKGHIYLTVDYWRVTRWYGKPGQWGGLCWQTGTTVCADSLAQARKDLIEAIGLHLNALEEVGEREGFFRENGIRMVGAENQAEDCGPEAVGNAEKGENGMVPKCYTIARWRNTTPVDGMGAIGIGFDLSGARVLRLRIDVNSARALQETLTGYLRAYDAERRAKKKMADQRAQKGAGG